MPSKLTRNEKVVSSILTGGSTIHSFQGFLVTLQWYAIKYYSREATTSAITATEARKTLFGLIQQVNDDHTAVEVVSRHGNAVILSKDDYDAMTETAYLLRNPSSASTS
ncbi:MAG: prevent-host-death family protein [Glaciihabitans sp.]|nr:prevent-host-death family protein [Glaciihabitans sp.]